MQNTKSASHGSSAEWGNWIEQAPCLYNDFLSVPGRNHSRYFMAMQQSYNVGKRVLEIGAGRGTISQYFTAIGREVSSLDESVKSIRRMREFFVSHGHGLPRTHVGSCEDMPVAESYFDFVCSVGLLEHFEDLGPTLSECNRVVKEGGVNFHVVVYPTDEAPGMIKRFNVKPPTYATVDIPNQFTMPLASEETPIETYSYVEYWSWKGKQCT